jgi:predicted ATPase/class 3 adenylate cyclase
LNGLLPKGTVTLLLADVEGSTRLWETQPEEMTAAVARLERTVSAGVAAHGGVRPVEQGEGDSFVAAFARASDAVACALGLQQASLAPIRLRIGLHTGEVQLRDERNYIGPTINRTARLRDLAHGGQTVLSGTTSDVTIDALSADAWLIDLGTHQLRDLPRPERVVQLCHPHIRNEFPPLRTANLVAAHNLPTQLTSFVGRGEQIKEVQQLLAENRLVTLTGAGGAGKTRLSVEIAAHVSGEFSDGAWYADLAPITEPDVVPVAVARALGLPDQPGRSTVDTLLRFIGDRQMLVVLDNCEHVLEASAELVVALVGGCPALTLLATSREPIGVSGEVTWRVPSLSIADEAIELFTDRARRARPDFSTTDRNAAAVMEICRRLDGMPLAIELAAARVRALSLTEILDGLHDRFRLLTGGSRTALRRQQTLYASVEWSHALLTGPERTLFRRLAVFMGGFDLDAAHAVGAGAELPRYQVLDQLTLLVDKSLVVAEDSRGHMRYRLLETVRQYALEKLGGSDDADAVRERHRDHYMAMVNSLLTRDRDAGQEQSPTDELKLAEGPQPVVRYADARAELAVTEVDNLRAAFAWTADLESDPDVLMRAARGAAWLLDLPLAERLADAAIHAGAGAEAPIIRAHALSFLSRGQEADAVLAEALRLDQTDGGRSGLVLMQAINRHFALADPVGAKELIDGALQRTGPQARSCIDAFLTVHWAAMGKPAAASAASQHIIWDQLPIVGARVTAWAITLTLGDAGATAAAVAAAEAGYPIPIRGFFVITDAHIGALLLAGRIADAQKEAEIFRRRVAEYSSPQFDPILAAVTGRAALGAGRVHTACSLLDAASMTFSAMSETHGWGYRTQLPRTTALAMSGMADEAAAAQLALEDLRHPGWRYLDYEWGIAHAWVAACQGTVREAIATSLSAAQTARSNGQFAAEVMCLQTATQFGDGSTVPRLKELADIVEGQRAGLAARFAAALNSVDPVQLEVVSEDFERMGDLVAAIDATAHAAAAYRRGHFRKSASGCATRAQGLAEQCGASTPALRRLSRR